MVGQAGHDFWFPASEITTRRITNSIFTPKHPPIVFILAESTFVLFSRHCSRDQFPNHLPAELTELLVSTRMKVRQFVIIEAQQMEQGDVEVADRMDSFDGGVAEFVGCADDSPFLDAAAREHHAHRLHVVATAKGIDAAALIVVWGSAKLAAPDHERVVEHSALFQVFNQCGIGFIDALDPRSVATFKVVVAVPAAAENLHEADTLFDHFAGEQASATEPGCLFFVEAVHLLRCLGFRLEINEVGHLGLHPVDQLITLHAGGKIALFGC